MKIFLKLVLFLAVLMLGALCLGVVLMIEDEPTIPGNPSLSAMELSEAEVFIQNTDPRNLAPGEVTTFTINEHDLRLLLDYGLSRLGGGATQVAFDDGMARLSLSAALPSTPLGDYLNVDLQVSQWGALLLIDSLRIGGLSVPGWLADAILQEVHLRLHAVPEYVAALQAVNGYNISPDGVKVIYQWQPDLVAQISDRGRDLLISEEDRERLMAHARNLVEVTHDPAIPGTASLASAIQPMFRFARLRQGDPVEENRAAILAMAMYVMGVSVPRVLGLPADTLPPVGRHQFTLSGRADFAQHFLVSAALTVSAGTGLADSIGLLKELEDSDGGSGFSFTDIGADRTGVRVAELAVADAETAGKVQEILGGSAGEDHFMAEFRDLPESLPRETFERIYGGVDTPQYLQVQADIERRISSVRLFREIEN